MKVSIVGCGSISSAHIGAISKISDARIISVADCIPERARAAADRTGARAFTSLESLLRDKKPDVLHICTPHYLHVPMACAAMEQGVSVLCEKPCAMTAEQLTELRAVQRRTGSAFGVCFQNRYNRSSLFLKSLIAGGEYGALKGMRAIVTWRRDADYYESGDWRGKLATEGGGVSAVTAHVSNDHLKGVIEVEDTVSALAEFRQGFRGVFYATTAHAVTSPVILEASFEDKTFRIEGDTVFEIDGGTTPVSLPSDDEIFGKVCWGRGHTALISDFYDCLSSGRPFEIDAFEGGKAVSLMLGIYESAKTNQRLEVEA